MKPNKNKNFFACILYCCILAMLFSNVLGMLKKPEIASSLPSTSWENIISRYYYPDWVDTGSVLKISTPEQLAYFSKNHSSYSSRDIELIAAIDLSAHLFTPIPDFTETFNGNSHTIKGLYIKGTGSAGLFKTITGATVKNIFFQDVNINGTQKTGTVAGSGSGWSTISNITVKSGSVNGTSGGIGGIIGEITGTFKVTNCINNAFVTAKTTSYNSSYAGGIAGQIGSSAKISVCANTGSIKSSPDKSSGYAGGIVAYTSSYASNIEKCFNTGDIESSPNGSSTSTYAGGILAYCYSSSNPTFGNCYNTGSIYSLRSNNASSCYAGGLVGYANRIITFNNCYNTGYVSTNGIIYSSPNKVSSSTTWYAIELENSWWPFGPLVQKWYNVYTQLKITKYITQIQSGTLSGTSATLTNSLGVGVGLSSYVNYLEGQLEYYNGYQKRTDTISTFKLSMENGFYKISSKNDSTSNMEFGGHGIHQGNNVSYKDHKGVYYNSYIPESLNISITNGYNYSTISANITSKLWKRYPDAPRNDTWTSGNRDIMPCSINVTLPFMQPSSTSSAIKSNNFGSAYAKNSNINNGMPFLKDFYWLYY